ncbi:LCP family protein [Streptomyces sp. NPDC008121]|uniref:LCP family protein n=1 Tax=Streptomyces sp. NPDC008121 TaxID=3364809 RepID=UPI0036E94082
MTDSAATPAEPDHPAEDETSSTSDTPAAPGRTGKPGRTGRTNGTGRPARTGRNAGNGGNGRTGGRAGNGKPGQGGKGGKPGTAGSPAASRTAGGGGPVHEPADPARARASSPTASGTGTLAPPLAPGPGGGAGGGGGPGGPETGEEPDGAPRGKRRHWLRWTALGVSVVLLGAAGAGWFFYRKLDGNITTDTSAAAELLEYEKERPAPVVSAARNILMIGSDTRAGAGNAAYGRDKGTQRSDTVILLHISAGRSSATAVSIPRDLMVDIPSCREADGKRSREQFAQFNSAYEIGGTACTIRTVERLTKIRVDHHMVIDFRGFKKMVDAVDGVEVCLREPIDDDDARLKLPAGRQTLRGEQALGFVRARKTLGNGSDTDRMDRQQQFLGALVNKVQSNGVLLNPTRLYPVLDAATKSITTDPGLDSLRDLYNLARSMRSIPTEKVQFLTVPRRPYRYDANRDELVQPKASQLFTRLREDKPVNVARDSGTDGQTDGQDDAGTPTTAPTPTFTGHNAAERACPQGGG